MSARCTRCPPHHSGKCFYCDQWLSPRHEHDHFPVPKRAGGSAVIAACVNCHDLKDRVPLDDWNPALHDEAWAAMTPAARIYVAKVAALFADSAAGEP